jgi:hypothetical protein
LKKKKNRKNIETWEKKKKNRYKIKRKKAGKKEKKQRCAPIH